MRLALADTPKLALRLMLAHVIGGGRWWRMEAEPQRPATTMIGASMGELLSQAGFTDRQKETATLAAGTQLIDTLGSTLKVDIGRHWHPDDTFFTLVKDREVVAAMLSEVIGATAANSYLTETVTKKKVVIRKALAGEGRAKVEAWLPRYMSFPQQGYTKRPMRPAQRAQA